MKPGPKPSPAGKAPRLPAPPPARAAAFAGIDKQPRAPIMPEYMATDPALEPARLVWDENLERVTANGCHEGDSDLFARYCSLEAWHRSYVGRWMAGEEGFADPPKAAFVESLRKMGELLGIAGPSSRLRMPAQPQGQGNIFNRNGKR